jgi:hypothetical protein
VISIFFVASILQLSFPPNFQSVAPDLYTDDNMTHSRFNKRAVLQLECCFDSNYFFVQMKLYTKQGVLKYKTDCAPNNGYFLIPLYDKVGTFRHVV